MSKQHPGSAENLRKRAEALLVQSPGTVPAENLVGISELAQELAIYQAELELQNEELRETQSALQEARDRFAELYEHAPTGYVLLDASGIVRQSNATWGALLNRMGEDLRGLPFSEMLVDEDAPVFLARYRAFFRNPAEKRINVRVKRKDCAPFHARIEARPKFNRSSDAGEINYTEIMVVVSDISELQEARQQIENRNKELELANARATRLNTILLTIRNVSQLIAKEDDSDRLIQGVCGSLIETMGYYNAWIALLDQSGQVVTAIADAGFNGRFESMRQRLFAGEFPYCMRQALQSDQVIAISNQTAICTDCVLSGEYGGGIELSSQLRHDGKIFGILSVSLPRSFSLDPEEQVLLGQLASDLAFAMHKIQDAKNLKRSEEELRRRENQLRKIFEILPIGLWLADKDGTLLLGNPMGIRIWGAEPRVPISQFGIFKAWRLPSRELIDPDDWALTKAIRHGMTVVDELLEIESFDGKRKTILNYAAPLLDDNGQVEGAIAVNLDISDRQTLEEQLRQAQKMDSIGRLAGGVAHDFNNMLGVILCNAEMALEKLPSSSLATDCLQEIIKAAHHSAEITRQLLAFARKQTIAPQVLDLNETLEGMLKMLRRLIGENIHLVWLPGQNLWPVKMDPSQIDQILANLCINARDAIAGVGKVIIETNSIHLDDAYCALHADFVPGDYVLLAVSDSGCGMDSQTVEKLFEPFFTTKSPGKGTGLGLATVYGIVKQNNGFINVYSEPGNGTTFKIYLPRSTGSREVALPPKDSLIPMGQGETILIVEDEPAILRLSRTILVRLGYKVLTAATPGEAVKLAETQTERIDLLISDVIMPEMNGRDLSKKLLGFYPHVKLLFMSGYTADVIAHHGVLDEGVEFIQKPFSTAAIAQKIRRVLGDKNI